MKINEEIRLINKLLLTGDFGTVEKLKIDKDFFSNKECRDAYEYIRTYTKNVNTYGYVPSPQIFSKKFPGFLLLDEVPEPLPVLCAELRDALMKTQVNAIMEQMQIVKNDPYKVIEMLQSSVSDMLAQHTANTRLFQIEDCGDMLKEHMRMMSDNKGVMGIPWPFPSLNEQTMGIKKGDWIVEYGRPKAGKTSIVVAALERIYENGKIRVGVFNFEDSEFDILCLFMAYRAKVDYFDLKRGRLNEEERARYDAACDSIVEERAVGKLFFVENCPGADINHIKSRIDEFSLDVVVINGVYFLKDVGSKKVDMDWKVVTNISRGCKQLAKEKQVAIIGITQANRQSEQVAYADAFTQDCDAMIKVEPIKRIKETKEMWTKCSLEYARGGGQPTEFCIYTKLGIALQEVAFPEEEIKIENVQPVNKVGPQQNPFGFNPEKKKKKMFD